MIIEASDFVGVKSFKAKGKRLTTFTVEHIEELEPTRMPEIKEAETDETEDTNDFSPAPGENGQMNLF